jgi:hypothetical protein
VKSATEQTTSEPNLIGEIMMVIVIELGLEEVVVLGT